MAFQRDRVEDRKVWLTEYMEELARRKREGEPELTLYDREQINFISYKDFVDKGTYHEFCTKRCNNYFLRIGTIFK